MDAKTTNSKCSSNSQPKCCFQFGITECRHFPKPTHRITEMEVVYINKGEGVCFAGDGISQFKPGELFFFYDTSHYFKSASQFYKPNFPLKCGSTYMRFSKGLLPSQCVDLQCFDGLRKLCEKGRQGIRWRSEAVDSQTIKLIESMEHLRGFERYLTLLTILNRLGESIGSAQTIADQREINTRLNGDRAYKCVVEFISQNYHQTITLDELADYADMNRTALCRHFRGQAKQSIFDFLLRFRINHARKQLLATRLPISTIAQESGFNNLSNFNVQFKKVVGQTPGDYRTTQYIRPTNE